MGIVELIQQELIRQGKEEGMKIGLEEGIEQGIEQGEALKEYEFVHNLYEAGFDTITIAISLKIPESRVLELLEKKVPIMEEEE